MTLAETLDRLQEAADAAREIGLVEEASRSEVVLEHARERVGFSGSTYVLALAGGTGVGKSSLLNALAGRTVSAVRAVRPTTDEPIAWIAESRRDELAPLLAWLDVRHITTHGDEQLASVAILDLPDVDATWAKAVEAGAAVTMPLADQFWGDRYGKLEDPFGHSWSLSTPGKPLSEEEIRANMAKMGDMMQA